MLPPPVFALAAAALVPPSPALVSRRALLAAGIGAPASLVAWPQNAIASVEAKQAALARARVREAAETEVIASRDPDPLTASLQKSRGDLARDGYGLLERQSWDAMRKLTSVLIPKMTFRGYVGESVKSRADAWSAAGEKELAQDILARRERLLVAVNTLENGIFARQTNDKKKMLSDEELTSSLTATIDALDSIIEKMYCQRKDDGTERRWRSGACEVLPLDPNLRDLAY